MAEFSTRPPRMRKRHGARPRRLFPELLESRMLLATVATGTGLFGDTGQRLGDEWTIDVAVADFDGDGDLDAFAANTYNAGAPNKVWLNDSEGNFTNSGQNLGSHDSHGVSVGDVDGDGDVDAFVVNMSGQGNRVWLNNGDGLFSDSSQTLGASESAGVSLGDLDGDGDLDAFVANGSSVTGPTNKVWLNDGTGTFSDSGQNLGSSFSRHVSLGDLDGDGDLDAFVANGGLESDPTPQPNTVWRNDGSGIFIELQSLGDNVRSEKVALGDLDGDGYLDAFVTNASTGQNGQPDDVWFNDGSGMFDVESRQQLGGNVRSSGVALADMDADGDLDAFVTSGLGRTSKIWVNNGGGGFSDSGQFVAANRSTTGVVLDDLDGDGDVDAFLGQSVCSSVNCGNDVWLNRDLGQVFHDVDSDGLNDDDGIILNGRVVSVFLDVDNDGVPDDSQPFSSTTTDQFGDFSLAELGLLPGQYIVSQEVPAGWTQTLPANGGNYSVTIPDQVRDSISFGNLNPAIPRNTYHSTDVPKAIREPKGNRTRVTTSVINIPDAGTVHDLNVELDITHTYDRDLDVFLLSPDGTRVELFTAVGSDGDNFTATSLDDEAGPGIIGHNSSGEATPPFTGQFVPEGSLSDFDGVGAQGSWTLEITDRVRGGDGLLNSWSLTVLAGALQTQPGITVTPASGLVTGEVGTSDSFTVVLDSAPTAEVTIGLSSSNAAEGVVSPNSLTFTPIDWHAAQLVTVTGIDDLPATPDGDIPYTIVTAAAVSLDTNYSDLDSADVSVTNLDNDGVPSTTIHVADLDASATSGRGGKWNAAVTVTVHDANDSPISGGMVTGSWSAGASGSSSCTTDLAGICSVTKSGISKHSSSATFAVVTVSHPDHNYEQGDNHDPDSDSSGTIITVSGPSSGVSSYPRQVESTFGNSNIDESGSIDSPDELASQPVGEPFVSEVLLSGTLHFVMGRLVVGAGPVSDRPTGSQTSTSAQRSEGPTTSDGDESWRIPAKPRFVHLDRSYIATRGDVLSTDADLLCEVVTDYNVDSVDDELLQELAEASVQFRLRNH